MAQVLPDLIKKLVGKGKVDIIMAILSNYTPDSLVNIRIKAPVSSLDWHPGMAPEVFAQRMKWACDIAQHDRGRAATHNKGIFNGIDAVALATGNDFRAIEAGGHSFAVKNGRYKGLSRITLEQDTFCMELETALSVGTVGGLTRLHPLADKSLQILGNPNARSLMKIAAAVGLASNFAALASLVTTGIQQGHMKMHLKNILHSLNVKEAYHKPVLEFFHDKTVSMAAVKDYVAKLE
jgi:hydroxymethylglutaryl-CoA reductase